MLSAFHLGYIKASNMLNVDWGAGSQIEQCKPHMLYSIHLIAGMYSPFFSSMGRLAHLNEMNRYIYIYI